MVRNTCRTWRNTSNCGWLHVRRNNPGPGSEFADEKGKAKTDRDTAERQVGLGHPEQTGGKDDLADKEGRS